MIAAHDVGRAINPQQCEAQIQGAVQMGLGYALTEGLPCKDGMPVTFKTRAIGVLRAQHMPEVEVILVEEHGLKVRSAPRGSARSAWCRPPARWRRARRL